MKAQILGAAVRAALQAMGGASLVSDSEVSQAIGAATVLATVAWSVYQKYQAQQAAGAK